ncbi:MAG: tetratricopeptide repeat protein, partial [Chitinophaga rupis]
VVRVTSRVEELPFSIESFTILFSDVTSNTCRLDLCWDKTVVSFKISTDIDSRIMTQIDNALNKDNRPYFPAALYYLDNGKDLNKALEWFDKAIAQNPTAYYAVYQKARCQAKMGRKQDAIATAKRSIELSKQANNADYVTLNEKLIASLQ